MTALDRKLLRDLGQLKGQAAAIALVMACGVATFVMSVSTYRSLDGALAAYYDRYRFADVFAHLKRAPNGLAARVADLPGVRQVQTRVVVDVTLDVPGMKEPATGRLVSIPDAPAPMLNRIHLRAGRYVEPGRRGEVLAHEAFAAAHGLKPGDAIAAVVNGQWQRLRVVGVALSPEYVYAIRPGEMFPDDRRFGVLWVAYSELAPAYDLDGAFNDIALSLGPGASVPEVVRRLDDLTADYGGAGAYGRADQLSHTLIDGELTQLRAMAFLPPTIFLSVSAFLLNVVMSRLIGLQRGQIAVLKAFGYSAREVAVHYLKFVLLLVACGGVLGAFLGAYLGREMTGLYAQFFKLPVYDYRLEAGVVVRAVLLTAAASVVGTLSAVRGAVLLPPAEAMRPEPPADYRGTLLERVGLHRLLTPAGRMILRRLGRQPVRSGLTVVGIALSVAILVMGGFVQGTVSHVLDVQFFRVQRYDVSIGFAEPGSPRAVHDAAHLPGVMRVEPFRGFPARLRFGSRSRRVGVTGLVPDPHLFRPLDAHNLPIRIPEDGLVVSAKLADILGAKPGDMLTVEVLEGERPVREVVLAAVAEDFAGLAAYMDIRAVRRMLRETDTAGGAFLAVDPAGLDELYARLKKTPRVASVAIKSAALRGFERTMAENLLRMRAINLTFAVVIAFGVVYNTARIALAERERELATLRVLGFTRREVSALLLGELAVLTVLALPVGMVFGYGLASLAVIGLEPSDPAFLNAREKAEAEARVRATEAAGKQSESRVEAARREHQLAEQDLARARKARASGSASAQELETAEAREQVRAEEVRAALFATRVAAFELELAKAALIRSEPKSALQPPDRRMEMRSPVDGKVLRVFQESAAVVAPGTRLLELGDPADLELVIEVLSTDAVKIAPGQRVVVERWGGDEPLAGRVRLVEPAAFLKVSALGVEEQRVNVVADFTDPPEKRSALGDAYRVEARVVVWEATDVVKVPAGALFRTPAGTWAVFAVRDGVARLTTVELGRVNAAEAEVRSGLSPGDRVLLHPSVRVKDGVRAATR